MNGEGRPPAKAPRKPVIHHDDQVESTGPVGQSVVTVPTSFYFALAGDAARWRRIADWRAAEFAAWRPPAGLQELRRITSVESCGVPDCEVQVELIHPLPRWAAAQLPDLSWVRCPRHTRRAA